jgi:hypothetical protein
MARLSTGWVALPGAGHCEAHVREAMVVVESPAALVDHGGPQHALYSGGIVWLPFVDDGEASVNEEAPDGYQLAALLRFFLFVDNLVGRLERGQPPTWQWLGSGQWQLLLLFAGLTLFCQLLYWSEAIRSDSHCP